MNVDQILEVLKIRPLSEDELSNLVQKKEIYPALLRGLCSKAEVIYYIDKSVFGRVKENIYNSFNLDDDADIDVICLFCFFLFANEVDKLRFIENIEKISPEWLFLILGKSMGKDPCFVVDVYNNYKNILSLKQKLVFDKYFVSQKVGLSIDDLNTKETLSVPERNVFFSKSLKIAVCVSGQLRGFEEAKRSWDTLFRGHEVDYYVHTWSNIGSVNKEAFKSKRIYPEFLKKFLLYLEDSNPDACDRALSYIFNESGMVDKSKLYEIYGRNAHVKIEDDNLPITNPEKMYYKIKACFGLIDEPEDYDLVVRIRPDLVVKEKLRINWDAIYQTANEGAIFAGYGYNLTYYGFGVDDKLAIGTPSKMKIYSSFWDKKDQYSPIIGHASLASYLFDNKIDVKSMDDLVETYMNDVRSIDEKLLKIILKC